MEGMIEKTRHALIAWDETPFHIELSALERNFLFKTLIDTSPRNIVEWGSGGSTILFAENKFPATTFISIEHNKIWYDKLKDIVAPISGVAYRFIAPSGPFTAYGTIEEEDSTYLQDYIHAPADISDVDLFFVDGVVRISILERIAREAKPGSYILVHDTYRTWYDKALALFSPVTKVDSLTFVVK